MIQTTLIKSEHNDLITDASYDLYGLRLATCGLDKRIIIWTLDEQSGAWGVEDDWKAHDAAVSKLSWAHPEFGRIIASSSFDRTVKVWMQHPAVTQAHAHSRQASENETRDATHSPAPSSQWREVATLLEAKGTVRAVEFAPHYFGLKLATISTDNYLRIYESFEQPPLTTWQLVQEIDIPGLRSASSPSLLSRTQTLALATPTQTTSTLDGASPFLVAQALQQSLQSKAGTGNPEADGGWCISWCKDKYWGEVIAVGCGVRGVINIMQLSSPRHPKVLLKLDPSPAPSQIPSDGQTSRPATSTATTGAAVAVTATAASAAASSSSAVPEVHGPPPFAITCVAWAPTCGRSFHLIATGGRDGRVRIWRVKPAADDDDLVDDVGDGEDARWTATVVADFDHNKSTVNRVEWNITGTVLSSAGNDGRIRLWKATEGNVWRPAASISVDDVEEDHDIDMDRNQ